VPDVVTGLLGRFSFSITWILAAGIAIASGSIFLVLPASGFRIDLEHLGAGVAAVGLVLFALAAVTIGVTMATLSTALYQILEGYLWWRPSWRHAGIERHQWKRQHLAWRIQELKEPGTLEADLLREKLRRYPANEKQIAPTAFGNAMRAFETYGADRYHLDSQTLWMELQSVIPRELQAEVAGSRVGIDFFVAMVYLSTVYGASALALASWDSISSSHQRNVILLVQGVVFLLPVPFLCYRAAIFATAYHASAVQAMVNIGRLKLAEALALAMPPGFEEELVLWRTLCRFVDNRTAVVPLQELDKFRAQVQSEAVGKYVSRRPTRRQPSATPRRSAEDAPQ